MQKFLDSFDVDEDFIQSISMFTDMTDHSPYFVVELYGDQEASKKLFYNKVRTNYFDHKFDVSEKGVNFHLYFDGVFAGLVALHDLFSLSWRCRSENVPYGLQVSLIEKLALNPEATTFESWTLSEDEAEICIISKKWSNTQMRKIEEDDFFKSKKFLYFGESLFYGNVKWSRISTTDRSC